MPRTGRARGQSDRCDHRQPKRQERGKRGISIDPPGYDAGKKIKGKKRHVLVDTQGLLICAIIHAADIQDRDGGVLLMSALFGMFPFLLKLYADSGYQGPKFQTGLKRVCRQINLEIVKRSDAGKFVVLPIGAGGVETHRRPSPPSDLSDEQAAEWVSIVSRMPADWFSRETMPLLAQYCRHIVAAKRVQQLVASIEAEEEFDLGAYDKALKMQARESSAICSLATKMRISQQSTYDRTKKKGPSGGSKKPWDL